VAEDDALAALRERLERLEGRYDLLRDFAVRGIWHALDRAYAHTEVEPRPRCLACGEAQARRRFGLRVDECVFGGGRIERLECRRCGCVFGPLTLLGAPSDFLAADYRLLYEFYSEGDSTEAEIRTFEALDPKPGELYLNWGAGAWSSSIEILRARGYDVWGYEPNAKVTRPFIVSSRDEISARFDGVFSNNVIEHLTDPAAELRDIASVMKPKGRMAHASPCFEWSYAFTRFHVFFPLGDSLSRLAARTDLAVTHQIDDGEYHVRVLAPRPSSAR